MASVFDTFNVSKRLRDAGAEERAADAIVELVRYSTDFPDTSGLATKADIAEMATKADISISEHRIRAELHDQLRVQGFALVGAMTAVVGLAIIKLFPDQGNASAISAAVAFSSSTSAISAPCRPRGTPS
jgi:hypothetical protein